MTAAEIVCRAFITTTQQFDKVQKASLSAQLLGACQLLDNALASGIEVPPDLKREVREALDASIKHFGGLVDVDRHSIIGPLLAKLA